MLCNLSGCLPGSKKFCEPGHVHCKSESTTYHRQILGIASQSNREVYHIHIHIGCPNGMHCVGTIFCLGGGGASSDSFLINTTTENTLTINGWGP